MLKKVILLFISMAFAFSAAAQQQTVTGVVTDAESEEPLPGVTVLGGRNQYWSFH